MDNLAIQIARTIVESARDRHRLTYKDLANEINWGHPLGRGLGRYLETILEFCAARTYPPLTTLVVKAGTRYPPNDALQHIRRVIGDFDVELEQERAFAFNWETVPEFGFIQPPQPEIDFSRMFAKRTWGFTPEEWGMLGLSDEGIRDRRLESMDGRPIYVVCFCSPHSTEIDGSGGEMTIREEDRGRMLGIAEIQPAIANPETHLSFNAREEMTRHWGRWRWQYGLEMTKAWRFISAPWTKEALPHARSLGFEVTKDVVALTQEEVRLVSQYAYAEVRVFGKELRPVMVALREPMHTTYLAICENRDVLTNARAPKL